MSTKSLKLIHSLVKQIKNIRAYLGRKKLIRTSNHRFKNLHCAIRPPENSREYLQIRNGHAIWRSLIRLRRPSGLPSLNGHRSEVITSAQLTRHWGREKGLCVSPNVGGKQKCSKPSSVKEEFCLYLTVHTFLKEYTVTVSRGNSSSKRNV